VKKTKKKKETGITTGGCGKKNVQGTRVRKITEKAAAPKNNKAWKGGGNGRTKKGAKEK